MVPALSLAVTKSKCCCLPVPTGGICPCLVRCTAQVPCIPGCACAESGSDDMSLQCLCSGCEHPHHSLNNAARCPFCLCRSVTASSQLALSSSCLPNRGSAARFFRISGSLAASLGPEGATLNNVPASFIPMHGLSKLEEYQQGCMVCPGVFTQTACGFCAAEGPWAAILAIRAQHTRHACSVSRAGWGVCRLL
jgi:hypothetical protein